MIKVKHKDYCECGCVEHHESSKNYRALKLSQIIFGVFFLSLIMIFEEKISSVIDVFWFYLGVYLFLGIEVIKNALIHLFKRDFFDETFLILIATVCAFIAKEYDESVIVMALFQIGELIEDFAVEKTHDSIESLLSLKECIVHLKHNNSIIESHISDICMDDIIIVYKNERIPLDGTIIKGNGMIDISTLVGKEEKRNVKENENVFSGSISNCEYLEIKVTKTYNHSTVHSILDLIDSKTLTQTKSKKIVDKFSKIYTPSVVFGAILVVMIPTLLFHQEFNIWLYKACLFLVVSCPCAIVISIPLAYYISIGISSKIGILNKGTNYLKLLKQDDDYSNEINENIKKKTSLIVNENIISVILVKSIAMIWGLFGELPMWAALLSDTGICILCILNCLRLLLIRKGDKYAN